jgi:hypothetical protein
VIGIEGGIQLILQIMELYAMNARKQTCLGSLRPGRAPLLRIALHCAD